MAKIFISYRRDDAADAVRTVYERLLAEFGPRNIFFDVDNIPMGMDFRNVLRDTISNTEVMLVLIGPRWLIAGDYDGRRRLDDPHDFVRMEIEQALQLSIPVIPVLLEAASLPRPDEVPDSLRPLLYRHAVSISFRSTRSDVQNLIQHVKSIGAKDLSGPKAAPPRWKVKILSAFASMLGMRSILTEPSGVDASVPLLEVSSIHVANFPAVGSAGGDDVFVSYARDDMSIMQKVKRHLARSEISVWTDEKLQPGTPSWKKAIENAIENSTFFIVLLTPNAKQSEFVLMELGYALAQDRVVLPVLAQGTNRTAVPIEIINRQWTDITVEFDEGMSRLVQTLIAYRAGQVPPRFVSQRR